MGCVTLALVGFFTFLILRVTAPEMTPLFTNLTLDDSAAIVKELDREGVAYELRGKGNVILVPKRRVARLRMRLAETGLPKGGGVGYEIFDKSDALGTTSFVQNINAVRALEGELERTIRTLDSVQDARVHLVMPERPLFSRDKVEPSASIVLRVRGTLEPGQVRAIRHLVATAVNGLRPQRISIVDEAGNSAGRRRRPTIPTAVSAPTNGSSRSRAGCASRWRESSLRWSVPAMRGSRSAPISISTASRKRRTNTTRTAASSAPARPVKKPLPRAQANNEVTVGNEIPQGQQTQTQTPAAAADANAGSARPEQENRRNRQLRDFKNHQDRSDRRRPRQAHFGRRAGRRDATARTTRASWSIKPRSKEEIDQIAALVRSAIGFDQKRGDQVEVVNLRVRRAAGRSRSPRRAAGCPHCISPRTTSCGPSKWW